MPTRFSRLPVASLLAALLAVWLSLAPVQAGGTGSFNAETFTLDNGLQVVVIPNHRAPIVVHMVWYRVGGADEAAGKSGLAHFLEHLLFMGTKTMKPKEFSAIVARNGGEENAATSHDYTYYYQTLPVDGLERMMKLEADRMQNLVLSKKVVEPERKVVLEERRGSVDADPTSELYERALKAAFGDHPYGGPVLGWPRDINSTTVDDLIAFYKTHYAPNNAVVILAGDVTARDVRPMIERTYGKVPRRDVLPRSWLKLKRPAPKNRLVMRDARVEEELLLWMYPAPGPNHGDRSLFYPAFVLSHILGGGTTSRLYKALVLDQEVASNIDVFIDGYVVGPALLYIEATRQQGVTMAELEAALKKELRKIAEEGFTQAELDRAIRQQVAEAVYDTDSLFGAAEIVGEGLMAGLSLQEIDDWPKLIGNVTLADLNRYGRIAFDPKGRTAALLLKPKTKQDEKKESDE